MRKIVKKGHFRPFLAIFRKFDHEDEFLWKIPYHESIRHIEAHLSFVKRKRKKGMIKLDARFYLSAEKSHWSSTLHIFGSSRARFRTKVLILLSRTKNVLLSLRLRRRRGPNIFEQLQTIHICSTCNECSIIVTFNLHRFLGFYVSGFLYF